MKLGLLSVSALLLLGGLALIPAGSAMTNPVFECRSSLRDAQGDGTKETWNDCTTPPCGCMCPYAGAGVVVEAAGQQRGAYVATSGCQTVYGTSAGPADGGPVVSAWPIVGGGALGPLLDSIIVMP